MSSSSPTGWLAIGLCVMCLPEGWLAEEERMWRERAEGLKQPLPPELEGATREEIWRMLGATPEQIRQMLSDP